MKRLLAPAFSLFCLFPALGSWSCAPQGAAGAGARDEAPGAALPEGWSQLRVGMSQKDVYDLLGLPVRVEGKETLTAHYRFGSVVFEGADGYGYDKKGVLRSWKPR